jgi:diguanylate cyclase (GGDEF)-like protein
LHDQLTGLFNRAYLTAELETLRPGDAVVLLDLDHFKSVNDKHGHVVGDEVLRTFAADLKKVIGADDCAARWGGEEFCLLVRSSSRLVRTGSGWRASKLAEGLRRRWRASSQATTLSGGVAEHTDGSSGEATVAMAGLALDEAKRTGGDRIVTSGPGATPS